MTDLYVSHNVSVPSVSLMSGTYALELTSGAGRALGTLPAETVGLELLVARGTLGC